MEIIRKTFFYFRTFYYISGNQLKLKAMQKNHRNLKKYKALVFVDQEDLKEIVENLGTCGFESIETCDSHYETGVEFVGHLKDIENWAGEFNRFGITDDDIIYKELTN